MTSITTATDHLEGQHVLALSSKEDWLRLQPGSRDPSNLALIQTGKIWRMFEWTAPKWTELGSFALCRERGHHELRLPCGPFEGIGIPEIISQQDWHNPGCWPLIGVFVTEANRLVTEARRSRCRTGIGIFTLPAEAHDEIQSKLELFMVRYIWSLGREITLRDWPERVDSTRWSRMLPNQIKNSSAAS